MPSSITATSGRRRSSRSESGSPIWLLKFPAFRNTSNSPSRSDAIASLVVVLPTLPVMATTLVPERLRTEAAIDCRAKTVFSTWTKMGICPSESRVLIDVSDTTAPHAPREIACLTNAWPS